MRHATAHARTHKVPLSPLTKCSAGVLASRYSDCVAVVADMLLFRSWPLSGRTLYLPTDCYVTFKQVSCTHLQSSFIVSPLSTIVNSPKPA